jgi:hypothetical protein
VRNLGADTGVSNIAVHPGASCDTFAVSWDFNIGTGSLRYTYAFQVEGAVLREWHSYTVGVTTYSAPPAVDSQYCQIAIEKGRPAMLAMGLLMAVPNPFHSEIRLSFDNPGANARLEVFDVTGTRVTERREIRGTTVSWNPARLAQGTYIAQVMTREKIFATVIHHIK